MIGGQPRANAMQGQGPVTPVWVFLVQPSQFDHFLQMVQDRRQNGQLFSLVSSEILGRTVSPETLQKLLSPLTRPVGFQMPQNPMYQAQAYMFSPPTPDYGGENVVVGTRSSTLSTQGASGRIAAEAPPPPLPRNFRPARTQTQPINAVRYLVTG